GVQKDGITQEELNQAKSKILSRVVRSSERPMGRMQAIGMSWTYLGKYRSVDEELAAFDAVTLGKVRELLDRYPLTRTTTFAWGPLEKVARPAKRLSEPRTRRSGVSGRQTAYSAALRARLSPRAVAPRGSASTGTPPPPCPSCAPRTPTRPSSP